MIDTNPHFSVSVAFISSYSTSFFSGISPVLITSMSLSGWTPLLVRQSASISLDCTHRTCRASFFYAFLHLGNVELQPFVLHKLGAVYSLVEVVAVHLALEGDLQHLLAHDLDKDGA